MKKAISKEASDEKLCVSQVIAVEGRDDVTATGRAADALIIPTHGFGIARETWEILDKAYREKGMIILTDPDHAGEQIRGRLAEKFPEALHAYIARGDASKAGDIGVENAEPDVIKEALTKALERAGKSGSADDKTKVFADAADLAELGLTGCDGSAEARAAVCRELGIGYGNARAMIKRLKGFGIDINELREAVKRIKE